MTIAAGSDILATDFAFLVGIVLPYAGRTAPDSTWFICDGTAKSRSTYATLFGVICPTLGTVTMTIASPAVVTKTTHGLATGDAIYLTTTGALPTGLSINTQYWIVKIDANTFNLASSQANALAGTKINTSGSQSGTHTAVMCPFGVGDGTTTFNIPDMRSRVPVGMSQSDTEFAGIGENGGEKQHTLTTPEMPSHTHAYSDGSGSGGSPNQGGGSSAGVTATTGSTGGGGSHNILQPYLTLNYIIKGTL